MKTRSGFVSNSSSCSFLINNHTSQPLTLRDFVLEVFFLVDEYNREMHLDIAQEDILRAVRCYDRFGPLLPGNNYRKFGNEDDNPLGQIFDYKLRQGGHSKRFGWCLHECWH